MIGLGQGMPAFQELNANSHLTGHEGAEGLIRFGGLFTGRDKGLEGLLRQYQGVVIRDHLARGLMGILQHKGRYRSPQ